MANEVFIDTSYAIALSVDSDRHHRFALEWVRRFDQSNVSFMTTPAVLLEIGDSLARGRHRRTAEKVIAELEADPNVEVVPLDDLLFARAFHLYQDRSDKEWGLTDCLSFVVMADRGLTAALAADRHFEQAGFTALLLDETTA
jgi:hypothetical protein